MSNKETKHKSEINKKADSKASDSKGQGQASKNAIDPKDPKTWPKEHGGPEGPEPTRYGDWEVGGRCSDF